MSSQSLATEQLLELLLQLKKTTPAAAKQILNGQPSISYALITLMVSMNAIKLDVFYKVLAEYGNGSAAQLPAVQPPPPVPAVPPHLQPHPPYRNATPPVAPPVPVYPNGTGTPQPYPYGQTSQPTTGTGYAGYTQSGYPQYPPYGAQQHAPSPSNAAPVLPEALSNIPEDQKAIIMRVLSMTPEQINLLPPAERATYIQLRATLGVPTA
ncbi:hypothetical protein F5887DRAFT_962569 [Amanita rubescens]|nr:hypothetical protein F5887DRAFT_962569 [Amanita rubescens]